MYAFRRPYICSSPPRYKQLVGCDINRIEREHDTGGYAFDPQHYQDRYLVVKVSILEDSTQQTVNYVGTNSLIPGNKYATVAKQDGLSGSSVARQDPLVIAPAT